MSTCCVLRPSSSRLPLTRAALGRCSKDLVTLSNKTHTWTPSTKSHSPTLPTEIWLHIFEIVAYIPGIFAVSDHRAIEAFSEDYNGVLLTSLYDDVMKAKLAISQACRLWRKMILPLLFEFVVIKSGCHAREIADTLIRFRREQPQGEYFGRWIKRVEVMSSDKCWDEESADALIAILLHTPNLLVFSDLFRLGTMTMDDIFDVVSTLQELVMAGQLRRIDSSGGIIYSPEVLPYMSLLEVFISSQAIKVPAALPNQLHTLVIANSVHSLPSGLRNLSAPNLRHLITRDSTVRSCSPRNLPPQMIPNDGFAMRLKHYRWFAPFSTARKMERSRLTIADMPQLTSLTVDFEPPSGVKPFETFRIKHLTLERINFANFPTFGQRLSSAESDNDLGPLLDFLLSLVKVDDNPSLRTIGFYRHLSWFESGTFSLDSKVPAGKNFALFSKFLYACRERGISVEASIGARDHFYGRWQPFHLGLVPRMYTTRNLHPAAFY